MAREQSEPGWNATIKRNTFESVLKKGMPEPGGLLSMGSHTVGHD